MRKKLNKQRVIKRFLFTPKVIGEEWRWLEIAVIEQNLDYIKDKWRWIDIKFINQ